MIRSKLTVNCNDSENITDKNRDCEKQYMLCKVKTQISKIYLDKINR